MIRSSLRFSRLIFAGFLIVLCGRARAENISPVPDAQQASTPIPTALDDYVARAEPSYKWEKIEEQKNPQNTVEILKLVSQTWQGKDWTHRVEIIRPAKVEFPDTALVLVSFGSPPESLVARLLAGQIGAVVINVNDVPNQPLFGLREDALIARTFQKYIETGDSTWPLLLPMTKSVIAAMNAVQEYSVQNNTAIKNFIVGGASKRGWTSWLVAAADSKLHPNRVTGIIPIVYNNLNIPKQLPHQLESWGEYSPMIGDYTKLGLQDQTSTSRGAQLVAIVDPYTYRARFTMPKLLINGTNDQYWTPDATQFYLNDLPGSTSLYFAPNAGHDLANDYSGVLREVSEWFRYVADHGRNTFLARALPADQKFQIRRSQTSLKEFILSVPNDASTHTAFVAFSNTRDFRDSKWEAKQTSFEARKPQTSDYVLSLTQTPSDARYVALFISAGYPAAVSIDQRPAWSQSSEIHIFDLTGKPLSHDE